MINKNFLLLGFGRIFQAAIALISLRLMTTYLPKSEVGYAYLLFAIGAYFGLVFINPVGMYFNRHIHELQKKYKLGSFLKAMNLYFFCIGLISIPIVLFLQSVLKIGSEISFLQLATLIFLMAYGATWFQTLCPALNMLDKRKHFILINNIAIGSGLIFSVLGIFYIQQSAFIWVLGSVVGQLLGAIISLYYVRKFFLKTVTPSPEGFQVLFRKEVWFFCFPVAITTLFMWFQSQSYRLVVEKFAGAEILAGLGVGLGIAASLTGIVEAIVTQYYYPQYYSKIATSNSEERARAWENLFKNSLIIYVLMAATIVCCARPILNILVHEQYHHLAYIVVFGVFLELIRVLTNTVYTVSHSELKTEKSILPYALGGILSITGSIVVVKFFQQDLNFYLPVILIFASVVCFFVMYYKMNGLLPLSVSKNSLLKSVLPSIPLLFAYGVTKNSSSLIESLGICLLAGGYSGVVLWKLKSNFSELSAPEKGLTQ